MMRWLLAALMSLIGIPCLAGVQTVPPPPAPGALQVFFLDVEGGQSTLFVTPDGHSLLVDTGWPDHGGRDADRIAAAMKLAHVQSLDAVWLTHYHTDHTGGVPQLVGRVPVKMFVDHGPLREPGDAPTREAWQNYQKVLATGKYGHQVVHAGEKLPVPGFEGTVVSADGQVIVQPLPGAGQPNPYCASAPHVPPDQTENARSAGFLMVWGRARVLDLGDLTRDKEAALMCPVNRLGRVDLLVVSHHGWYQSSSPLLVNAIAPRVAVMDNGAVKGGSTVVLDTFRNAPNHPALWQLHYSEEGGAAHNTPAAQIANLQGTAQGPDPGYLLRATVLKDGTITVWNSRTGELRRYREAGREPGRQ